MGMADAIVRFVLALPASDWSAGNPDREPNSFPS